MLQASGSCEPCVSETLIGPRPGARHRVELGVDGTESDLGLEPEINDCGVDRWGELSVLITDPVLAAAIPDEGGCAFRFGPYSFFSSRIRSSILSAARRVCSIDGSCLTHFSETSLKTKNVQTGENRLLSKI